MVQVQEEKDRIVIINNIVVRWEYIMCFMEYYKDIIKVRFLKLKPSFYHSIIPTFQLRSEASLLFYHSFISRKRVQKNYRLECGSRPKSGYQDFTPTNLP